MSVNIMLIKLDNWNIFSCFVNNLIYSAWDFLGFSKGGGKKTLSKIYCVGTRDIMYFGIQKFEKC